MIVRLHKHGSIPSEPDLDLGKSSCTHAYVMPADPDQTIWFVDVPSFDDDPLTFLRVINHESLHVALHRRRMFHESRLLDNRVRPKYSKKMSLDDQYLLDRLGL